MQVEISEDSRVLIEKHLRSGQFQSVEELVEQALAFFDEHRPSLDALREKIQAGLEDIDAGRVSPLDVADIKRRGRERLVCEQDSAGQTP